MKFDWGSFGAEQDSSVDGDTITQVQNKLLGVVFPDSYLALVKYSDEASPEVSSFPYGNEASCISEFFSFSPDATPYTISWEVGVGRPQDFPTEWSL